MPSLPPIALAVALLFSMAPAAEGALVFDKKVAEIDAAPEDEELLVKFPFKNSGDKVVAVKKVDFACSCLSAETDKGSYAPGEEGVVEAIFKLGSFTGVQRKSITVTSRAEGEAEDRREGLVVQVSIPDVITIEPQLMQWAVGSEPEPQTFTLKVPHPDPINIKGVVCSREGFEVELVEKRPGREYEIRLTPGSTAKAMLGVLKIETDCSIAKHRRKLAFFSVARKRKSKS